MPPFHYRERKPRRFSLIRLPLAHRANGSLLIVRFMKKQTEVIRLQTNTCPSMQMHPPFINKTSK